MTPEIRRDLYAERYERGETRWLIWELELDDVVMEIGAADIAGELRWPAQVSPRASRTIGDGRSAAPQFCPTDC